MGDEESRGATIHEEPPLRRSRRRRLAPEDRKRALIAAALELFNARPYDQVSVDDIAAAAAMSRPLLYHYYGGKHGVFLAALRQAADELVAAIREAAARTPGEWLSSGLAAYLDQIATNPMGFTTLVGHGSSPLSEAGETIIGQVRDAILDQIMKALLPGTEPPPLLRSVIRGWAGMVEVISRQWQQTGEPSRPELERILSQLFEAALETAARNDPSVRQALDAADWKPRQTDSGPRGY